jgi:HD-GYP domain-containing protein (c-di-GMP phosphodiesterase class II)
LQHILPAIRHHHERFDGQGYPAGLRGVDIPLASRILAVADTFDAMASSRAYRPAQELAVVLAEVQRCSGTQFDPAVVAAFLELAAEGALNEVVERQSRAHEAA